MQNPWGTTHPTQPSSQSVPTPPQVPTWVLSGVVQYTFPIGFAEGQRLSCRPRSLKRTRTCRVAATRRTQSSAANTTSTYSVITVFRGQTPACACEGVSAAREWASSSQNSRCPSLKSDARKNKFRPRDQLEFDIRSRRKALHQPPPCRLRRSGRRLCVKECQRRRSHT